ncbi:Translin [Kockovaella imperatae]|uniref:Translin n=1 Tax=Kockovaella imperatae TaxID=4999 RepID=A0A1Y1UM78_9TREE|nr:Translin [Kockovaella imperatae]ORX38235.1 Translin [Kockovaella imperatae]
MATGAQSGGLPSDAVPISSGTLRETRLSSVDRALGSVIASLEKEQELKKAIREAMEPIEDISRRAASTLNDIHSVHGMDHRAIAQRTLDLIEQVRPLWTGVSTLIPAGEFYRYSFAVGPTLRTLTQLVAYAIFIIQDALAPSHDVARHLGVQEDSADGVILTADDYLQGVIGAINELPRLSVNAVTAGNYHLPLRIASFVNDVFASYSQLNLRNDVLRRKFDSLKYDLKKCEDVIYDLTLRGLNPRSADVSSAPVSRTSAPLGNTGSSA